MVASIVGRRKRAFTNLGMSRHTYVTPALLCFICTVPAKKEAISLWYIPGDWHRDDMLTTSPQLHLGKSGRVPVVLAP